ncbi:MAG TPA: hypothetical protein VK302_04215, partial [Terriglobales bacterium]|nr:hypothetical protein [Terriglobales bacterium]
LHLVLTTNDEALRAVAADVPRTNNANAHDLPPSLCRYCRHSPRLPRTTTGCISIDAATRLNGNFFFDTKKICQ